MEVAVIDISHAAWAFEGRGATLSGCFWGSRNGEFAIEGGGVRVFSFIPLIARILRANFSAINCVFRGFWNTFRRIWNFPLDGLCLVVNRRSPTLITLCANEG